MVDYGIILKDSAVFMIEIGLMYNRALIIVAFYHAKQTAIIASSIGFGKICLLNLLSVGVFDTLQNVIHISHGHAHSLELLVFAVATTVVITIIFI